LSPPRKPSAPDQRRQLFLRLPEDISERIHAKAKATLTPLGRVVINELAAFPYLERQADLGDVVRDMKTILASYGARIAMSELNEAIKRALVEMLAAPTAAEREAHIDRLRVLHGALAKHEREVAQAERNELVGRIALLEKQLKAIEALPAIDIARDEIPGRKRILEDLRRAAAVTDPDRRKAAE
jgi:hypothetical protein